MTHPRARQAEVEREARRVLVARLLLSGVSDQSAIAKQANVDRSTISRDIKAIEAQWRAEAVADVAAAKGQDLARIERMIAGLWTQAIAGHLGAIDKTVKLLERKARMLGYDAPEKMQVGGDSAAPLVVEISVVPSRAAPEQTP
jgi:hypothetical protein